MVCVVELDAIAVDEADGCVRTEGGDRELLQEISPDLKIRFLLTVGLVRLRFSGFPSRNPTTRATAGSRPAMPLRCLPTLFRRLIRASFSGRRRG